MTDTLAIALAEAAGERFKWLPRHQKAQWEKHAQDWRDQMECGPQSTALK